MIRCHRAACAALLAALALTATANIPKPTPDASGRIPFDVYFDTSAPIGLRLDSNLIVVGFSKGQDGSASPAETAKWILPGDTLVAVNGASVRGNGLQRAVLAIRDAPLPKARAPLMILRNHVLLNAILYAFACVGPLLNCWLAVRTLDDSCCRRF